MSIKIKTTVITIIVLITISGFYLLQRFDSRFDPTEEKWRIYERALGLEIANYPDSTCEWLILGKKNLQVYVWAACKLENPDACQVRMSYATIFLNSTGDIANVELHKDFQDIAVYLPAGSLPISGSDVDGLIGRTCIRHKHPGPPYIIQQGTPLP